MNKKTETAVVIIDNSPAINAGIETMAAHISGLKERARLATDDMRRIGLLLIQQKEAIGHGQWEEWLAEKCPKLPFRTAQSWMAQARKSATVKNSCEGKDSDAAFLTPDDGVALGLLPEKVESEKPKVIHCPPIGLTFIQKACEWFNVHPLPERPATPEQEHELLEAKRVLLRQARPLIQMFDRLQKEVGPCQP